MGIASEESKITVDSCYLTIRQLIEIASGQLM